MNASRDREQLYDLFADPSLEVDAKIDRALDIGTEYLELPVGFFTRIHSGVQEIVRSTGDHPLIQPGESCPLDQAYCRRTIEIDSPLAVQDSAASAAISDAAVETFDLGAYIGAKVVVNDGAHGTVCFADHAQRETEFNDAESQFVELLSRLIGQALERRAYEDELEQREAELAERREIYRSVIDASFDLVFRIDANGKFTYVSPPVEELLGYPPEQYVGEHFVSMLPDQEMVELAGQMFEQVMAGETVEEYYFPLDHRTDDPVYVDVRVTPLFAGDVPPDDRTPADIIGVQGTAREATGRRRREQLIRVLNRVLRHNLRNDINIISGYAELLRDRLSDSDAELAGRIVKTSEDLAKLAETARDLDQNLSEPADTEPTDLVPLVQETVEGLKDRYPSVTVSMDLPETLPAMSAPRLEMALLELLDNAAKHAGEEPTIDILGERSAGRTVLRITDDGPGLPDQERVVLESGEETPLIHGSGLGLWLVHWTVQSLDGSLHVRDDGPGASIEVQLPAPPSEHRS